MAKYHINPETGRPGECTASVKDCKYASEGNIPTHYDSLDEAFDAYETINADKTLASIKKPESLKAAKSSSINNNSIDSESVLSIDDENEIEDAEIIDEIPASSPKLSAPTKPSEYQAAAPVETIESDKALTLVDELPNSKITALDNKALDWVNKVTSINPNSQEFIKHTQAISKIANKAFSSTASLSTNFLNNSSSRKNSASEKVGKDLASLRNVIEDMAPNEDTFKSKALAFLPGRNAVKKYFNRFESNVKQMDVIMKSLEKGQATLSQENAELAVERQQLWNDLGSLQEDDELLRSMDNKVVEKINEEKANGNAELVKALEQNVLFNIRQRRQDVMTQTAVTVQSYMAMGMIEENNNKLAQNVERTKTTTATALATSARIAESLGHQKKILEGVDFMRNTTNNLITDNAKNLQKNALEIQRQATTESVDTKVLSDSFDTMFKTMDDMDNFRNEANQNFLKTINSLGEQVNRANQYARERNQRLSGELSDNSDRAAIEETLPF